MEDKGIGMVFLVVGLLLAGGGYYAFQKFRDTPVEPGFKDFRLGPRGVLAYGGVLLVILGLSSAGVGLIFLFA